MANRYIVMGQLYITNVTSGVSVTGRVVADSAFTCTGAGTFTVDMANGTTGSISGTNVQGSPVALSAGANTITTTGAVADGQIDITIGTAANTNSVNTYSATSGGACGASIPTSADNLYGDANSFTAASQVVTVDAALSVKDFIWTNATNSPTLAGSSALNIYGDTVFIAAMSYTNTAYMYHRKAAAPSQTLTTNGLVLSSVGGIIVYGNLKLLDALNIGTKILSINNNGTTSLDTNGQTVTCGEFAPNKVANGNTITLGASVINCTSYSNWTFTYTLNADTSTFNCSGNFDGLSKTFNIVNLTGATSTITGSNTFATLALPSGTTQTITFTDGSTQTATTFTLSGDATHTHTLQGSSTAGWYLSQKYGNKVSCDYVSVSRSTISSSGKFYAGTHSTNGGNNTKWEFSAPPSIKTIKSYDKQTSKSGIVLDLPGYEATGSNINDISKYHNNGTITGATWEQLGSGLWVLSFDGTNDYVTITQSTSIQFTTALTISMWLYYDSFPAEYQDILAKCTNTFTLPNGYGIRLLNSANGAFQVWICGTSVATAQSTLSTGWTHIAMTYLSGTGGSLYKNGSYVASISNKGNIVDSGTNLLIGGNATLEDFTGKMKVEMFSNQKTTTEIAALYNQERSLFGV